MRIVVDSLPLLGEGGIATCMRGLLLHLAAAATGHEYHLYFRAFRPETRRRVERFLADPDFAGFGAHITRVPDRILEWLWGRRGRSFLAPEAWLGQPDLFFSTIYVTPPLRGIPVVMMAYDLIPLRLPELFGRARAHLGRVRRSVQQAAAVLAISQRTKRDFVELMGADPARVHVVYPAADSQFTPCTNEGVRDAVLARVGIRRPYLLYVGSLGPHKNVGTLVRVFRRLKQTRRLPHRLVLCGKAEWGPGVVREAGDLVAAGACSILDFVPKGGVPALYQGADAFAFLSLYEGFGLPPLEAMACGAPVVTSNAGSLPEVVGDAALQVSPTDEEAIQDALDRVLTDASLRAELRARGLRQAARFSWPEAARQTLKVFEGVVGAG